MAANDSLLHLIEIARNACDNAARDLAERQRLVDAAQAKRELLAGYWSEYQQRQRSIYQVDATSMTNFYQFVAKLKSSIERHEADSRVLLERRNQARDVWEGSQRQLKSLQKLCGRRLAQANQATERTQQKFQDELSSQRIYRDAARVA
ncbi:MAG: flagellar export protein FliJ [Burkholderiales bacterium]